MAPTIFLWIGSGRQRGEGVGADTDIAIARYTGQLNRQRRC